MERSAATTSLSPSPSHHPNHTTSALETQSSKQSKVEPSIVTAEPQGELFSVLPFAVNYQRLVQEQDDHDPFWEYFSTHEEREEVAQRCDIFEDLQDADRLFKDPTVSGLLREWYDGKIESRKEVEDLSLRPTWASVYGQAEEVTEYGDPTDLHVHDLPRPPNAGDDQVRRLLSAPTRGHKRVPFQTNRQGARLATEQRRQHPVRKPRSSRKSTARKGDHGIQMVDPNSMTDLTAASTADTSAPIIDLTTTTTTTSTPGATGSAVAVVDLTSTSAVDSPATASTGQSSLSSDPAQIMPPPSPPLTTVSKRRRPNPHAKPRITTEEDAERAGERAAEEGRFVKTKLENDFQEYSLMIDDCKLKSLEDESRLEIPVPLRPPMNYLGPSPSPFSRPYVPVIGAESIVSVALYSALRPTQKLQEFLVLGSQPLTVIRDAFYCLSDFTTRGVDDPLPNSLAIDAMDKKTSNSFLFIEGVFYVDSPLLRAQIEKRNELKDKEQKRLDGLGDQCRQRYKEALDRRRAIRRGKKTATSASESSSTSQQEQEELEEEEEEDMEVDLEYDDSDLRVEMSKCSYQDVPVEEVQVEHQEEYAKASLDYSQVILDWVDASPKRKQTPGFSNLQKKYMHDTLIQDLSIQINHPYLLVHQGNCEHIIMFRDLRLFSHQHDDLNRLSYPKQTFKAKTNRHRCSMCNGNSAYYVTMDDRLAGETPSYFCERCYDLFHYDEGGNILYDDYRVFEYARTREAS